MEQASFEFDKRSIDAAVAKIQMAASYAEKRAGFLPSDPIGLVVLRQHLGELREGLEVLGRLADSLQLAQDRQAALGKRP